MAPLFLEFAADRGEVATDAPELRASDRASLDAFREGAIDGRETARDSLHFRMGSSGRCNLRVPAPPCTRQVETRPQRRGRPSSHRTCNSRVTAWIRKSLT